MHTIKRSALASVVLTLGVVMCLSLASACHRAEAPSGEEVSAERDTLVAVPVITEAQQRLVDSICVSLAEVNKSCPQKISDDITLLRIEYLKEYHLINYLFRFNFDAATLPKEKTEVFAKIMNDFFEQTMNSDWTNACRAANIGLSYQCLDTKDSIFIANAYMAGQF